MAIARYLTHPEVVIDPDVEIGLWGLSAKGAARRDALIATGGLAGTVAVFSSAEVKAMETAGPIAQALGLTMQVRPHMHENDRSATGVLPPAEFEALADAFFAQPDTSVRGWETARAAQARIVTAVDAALTEAPEGDVLLVGHGAVGTLLMCDRAGWPIDRVRDQTPGGGCLMAFARGGGLIHSWQRIEDYSE